jgi:hypothetical protein
MTWSWWWMILIFVMCEMICFVKIRSTNTWACRLLYQALCNPDCTQVNTGIIGELQGFGRKLSCTNWGTTSALVWKGSGKPRKMSFRMSGIPDERGTEHLPNTRRYIKPPRNTHTHTHFSLLFHAVRMFLFIVIKQTNLRRMLRCFDVYY